jgi:hypothetical protein
VDDRDLEREVVEEAVPREERLSSMISSPTYRSGSSTAGSPLSGEVSPGSRSRAVSPTRLSSSTASDGGFPPIAIDDGPEHPNIHSQAMPRKVARGARFRVKASSGLQAIALDSC